jgi:hypothetical protein
VEELIYESAPDVTALTIDIRDSPGSVSQSFVPLAALSAGASLVSKGEL